MTTELRTEHPHTVRVPGILSGEPMIVGTRIGVAFIARLLQAGEEPSDIIASFPRLDPAAVYDAISYHLDHREEVDAVIADSTPEALARRYGYRITKKGKVEFRAS